MIEIHPGKGTVLLAGVVGSHAYGMNRPGSDVDRLGVYAVPTIELHGITPPTGRAATLTSHDPDWAAHEAGKYANLCLGGNPTALELMWLGH